MHKYTSDGRKVTVIGKLNATETIVQEIFCTEDGAEIPSGEQFVTKGLHDKPVVSWKEKQAAEINANYERLERSIAIMNVRERAARQNAAARIKALSIVATAATKESLRTLEDFVAGRITHVFMGSEYGECRIVEFAAIEQRRDDRDDLKLLSLFGRSDGTLQWRIHEYYDNSGSVRVIIPARSYEDALRLAQTVFDERVQAWRDGTCKTPPEIGSWKDVGGVTLIPLDVPEDVAAFWAKSKAESKARRIAELERQLEEARKA